MLQQPFSKRPMQVLVKAEQYNAHGHPVGARHTMLPLSLLTALSAAPVAPIPACPRPVTDTSDAAAPVPASAAVITAAAVATTLNRSPAGEDPAMVFALAEVQARVQEMDVEAEQDKLVEAHQRSAVAKEAAVLAEAAAASAKATAAAAQTEQSLKRSMRFR
jgi:hypothetical protein